jgi:ribonuclease P protein component
VLTKRQFESIYQNGNRQNGVFLRVLGIKGHGRVGIATSKSLGNKPRRNRQKRRTLEVYRQTHNDQFQQFDWVIVAKPGIRNASIENLKSELETLMNNLVSRWEKELES